MSFLLRLFYIDPGDVNIFKYKQIFANYNADIFSELAM
jgi:hypothetical protein